MPDQRHRPLAGVSAVEVGHAVLGDHVVHVAAAGDDARARLQVGTMREMAPSSAVEGRAMIGLPPLERAAPRMKSTWPPMPL